MDMIRFCRIKKEFEKPHGGCFTVMDDMSFTIERGEAAALTGTSGAGKTTLINMAAGLMKPDSGKVYINGENLYNMGEAKRDRFRAKNIGYIFQNFNLIPSLNAYENVMAALCFGKTMTPKERKVRCTELLEKVGLKDRMEHLPGQLSGGEQQRVCIARALANHPPVLLADEPTANLDAGNREKVTRLLLELCSSEQITLLLATHDETLRSSMTRVISLKERGETICY